MGSQAPLHPYHCCYLERVILLLCALGLDCITALVELHTPVDWLTSNKRYAEAVHIDGARGLQCIEISLLLSPGTEKASCRR